jgi:hypothetical protein
MAAPVVMAGLERAIALDIVLMQVARSSRAMTRRGYHGTSG